MPHDHDQPNSAHTSLDLERFFDHNLDLLCIADTDGFFRKLNPRWKAVLGYKPGELEGQRFLDLVHPDDLTATLEAVGELAATRDVINFANRYRHRDGSYLWLEWCASSVGTLVYATAREMTGRKLAETWLTESEKRFRALFETMHEGFAFHEVICNAAGEVTDYRYLDLNPAFEQLTGLKRETTVGRTVREVLPDIEEEWIQCFGRVALTGIPDERENYVKELDRYYRARAYSPEKGKFAVVFEETTTRRRADMALQASERRFSQLIQNSFDTIVILDADGIQRYVSASAERVHGYAPAELVDIPVIERMIHPDDQERVLKAFRQILETGSGSAQYRHRCKSGGWVQLEARGTNQLDNPDIRGVVVNVRDISANRQHEEELWLAARQYELLTETALDAYWIISRSGRVMEVNEQACRMYGYNREEMLQLSLSDLEARESAAEIADHSADIVVRRHDRFETRHHRKDGSVLDVEVSTTFMPDKGVFLAFVRNITDRKRAEEALYEKEQYLQTIIETSPECVKLLARDGSLLMMNRAGLDMIDAGALEEVTGQRLSCLVAERDRPAFEAMTERVFKGESCILEFKAAGLHGRSVWLETHAVPFRNFRGEITALLGVSRDITARKQAEADLKASEERFSSIMALSPDIISIISQDGELLYNSPAALRVHGYSEDDLAGLNTFALIHPDDRDEVNRVFDHLLENPDRFHTVQYRYRNKDGSYVWMECAASNQLANPLVRGVIAISRDIDDRKRLEGELALSEHKYRSLFDTASDAIFILDLAGNFIDANRTAYYRLGYTKEELMALHISQLDPPEFSAKVPERFTQIVRDGQAIFESAHLRSDGTVMPVEVNTRLMEYQGTQVYYSVIRDITERKRLEEEHLALEKQLLHTQKLESLGVLAGGIAHDFNNILMGIIGNADLALMRISLESPAVDHLRKIEQAAARAADLAKQMLAYSGKGKFVVEPIDLNLLIEEMFHMLEVSISKKAVLRLNPYHPLPSVEADATQMRQIVMNLVVNASEAIGDRSGVIAVTTGVMDCDRSYLKDVWLDENISEGLYVYLEVADTGCGMDREIMAKVFDPFFTTKFTGRGLGMAAVLGIIRGHKGAIKIYSEPGRGSTFKILLPASSKHAEQFSGGTARDSWRGSGTVLLVDDEETVRGIGAEMLRELGFTPVTAGDGREAIEIFRQTPDIALVILDLTMPHMDGEQCFRELRQLSPEVRVVMSSGYNEQEVTQRFVGKGLAGFIQKPYNLAALSKVIGTICRQAG